MSTPATGPARGRARRRALAALAALALGIAGWALVAELLTPLPRDWHRGANLTAYWNDELRPATAEPALRALRETGTTHVAIVPVWYQDGLDASELGPTEATPRDADVLHAVRYARSLGMTVTMKPHLDEQDGEPRRDISAADRDRWFAAYRRFLTHYARMARAGGAELLVVGTELDSMTDPGRDGAEDPAATARWRELIAAMRREFPGRLTYGGGTDPDGTQHVFFWDALDLIGAHPYWPLAEKGEGNPPPEQLEAAWRERGYVDVLHGLHERYDKPVVFTELGFASSHGTAAEPWLSGGTGRADPEPQRRGYEAAFEVWSEQGWVEGIYWWDWRGADRSQPGGGGHDPRGKPAEATLRSWNRIVRGPLGWAP